MEIIMRYPKAILLTLIFVLSTTWTTMGQDYKSIQQAFSESYTHEYAGEYTKAVESLKKIYDEDSYEINLRLGWLMYLSGLFTESTTYYQKALTLKPLSIEVRLGYAFPASALGNWIHVINLYEEILEIDPENSLTNYRLGSIYYGKTDYSAAIKYFEKVANHYPFDYDNLIMYAWTNFQLGNFREAKVLFNIALMVKPDDKSALEGLKLIK